MRRSLLLNAPFPNQLIRPACFLIALAVLPAGSPAWSQSVILRTKSPGKDDFGTAFCVDAARGLFVTDYQLVVGETAVRLGNQVDTKEFVAADRGKGLVLLKVPPNRMSALLLAKNLPAVDSRVALMVAPATLQGKFLGAESGEDYLLGLTDRRPTMQAIAFLFSPVHWRVPRFTAAAGCPWSRGRYGSLG